MNRVDIAAPLANTQHSTDSPLLSVTIPIYNEKDNILLLYQRTSDALDALGKAWPSDWTMLRCRMNAFELSI
jgi:hypothetical protein